jgi:hypothetical protein
LIKACNNKLSDRESNRSNDKSSGRFWLFFLNIYLKLFRFFCSTNYYGQKIDYIFHVPSSRVHLVSVHEIVSAEITVRDSINDPTGVGFKSYHGRVKERSSKSLIGLGGCVSTVHNLPVFSFDGKAFLAVVLNKWLSNVAKQNGLDPSRVSSHFSRIGGGCICISSS